MEVSTTYNWIEESSKAAEKESRSVESTYSSFNVDLRWTYAEDELSGCIDDRKEQPPLNDDRLGFDSDIC